MTMRAKTGKRLFNTMGTPILLKGPMSGASSHSGARLPAMLSIRPSAQPFWRFGVDEDPCERYPCEFHFRKRNRAAIDGKE
jgi:hypothetical protein